ncbi:hypothetical protein HanRHA438_Chr10g0451111 [Helianthus annuus]|nr:hypothetical protein HanIR_Chr10g0473241 [Helianthus annuus]KAJ0879408.1 hypothetical protein HanRHA438_Chr10g0451111 [Helianthus annuus]
MWRLWGYSVTQLHHPISHNIIMFDLPLLRPIPFSVFLVSIIILHPKEEPDQTDNYVKHYCCIYIWILCWPVLMQSKVCSHVFLHAQTELNQHVVSEHMLISQFCFRIHNSGIETWKTEFFETL